jgi:hypothetical protein
MLYFKLINNFVKENIMTRPIAKKRIREAAKRATKKRQG